MTTADRYARHEGLFGKVGQDRLARSVVAFVGVGGNGMPAAQQLAYAGVTTYKAIEHDIVTMTSLNRLVSATHSDINRPKLDVFTSLVQSIQPTASVEGLAVPFDPHDEQMRALLASADAIFSCVDNERARVDVLSVASEFGIPLFDLASDIGHFEDGAPWYGGRVAVAQGDGCPMCLGLIDQRALAVEHLTEDQREEHCRIYGIPLEALGATGPSVVSLNSVVASLAVTEFLVQTTGLRRANRLLTYRAERGIVTMSVDPSKPACAYCTAFRRAVEDSSARAS